MKRRPPPVATTDGEEEVPPWVLDAASLKAAIMEVASGHFQDPGAHPYPVQGAYALRRGREAEAQAWCAERGLSYAMTVLGWAHPSPRERAAGHTTAAGPTYARFEANRARFRANR